MQIGKIPEAIEVFKKGGSEASAYNNLGWCSLGGKISRGHRGLREIPRHPSGFYLRAYENLNKAKAAYALPSQR